MLTVRDHPAWVNASTLEAGIWCRPFTSGQRTWVVVVHGDAWYTYGQAAPGDIEPQLFRPGALPPQLPASLAEQLTGLGVVARWRNPDLWNAIATAIIRQAIIAGHARHLYHRLCTAHGTPVQCPYGVTYLIPTAADVAELPDEAFTEVGMAFQRQPLQAAAKAYLTHGTAWRQLPARQLADELQTVHRIGPWTAGVAVADFTHDWTLYPYADLEVRTWAATAAPDVEWPQEQDAFAERWRQVTADQLGPLTLRTLAWGATTPALNPRPRRSARESLKE